MTGTSNRAPEILILEGRHESMQPLADGLRGAGLRVDITHDLEGVRDAFFRRGGHDLIVLGPDLPDSMSRAAAATLCGLGQAVQIVAFGDRPHPEPRITRLSAFHPGSRAAVGAVVRLVLPIPESQP